MENQESTAIENEVPMKDMVLSEEGRNFTTSIIVAKFFEKEHYNVLQAIKNLECSERFNELNFQAVEYRDAKGEMRPAYRMTRDGFSFLAMGFTGKKAAAWKERFLEAFNAMEEALKKRVEPKEPVQPKIERESLARPVLFSSQRPLTKGQVEALRGLLQMESLLQKRTTEELAHELLAFQHVDSLEQLRQTSYHNLVLSILRRMLMTGGRQDGGQTLSPEYKAAMDGMICFWAATSDFTKREINSYVLNRCGVLPEDVISEDDCLKVLFAIWGGFSNHNLQWRHW